MKVPAKYTFLEKPKMKFPAKYESGKLRFSPNSHCTAIFKINTCYISTFINIKDIRETKKLHIYHHSLDKFSNLFHRKVLHQLEFLCADLHGNFFASCIVVFKGAISNFWPFHLRKTNFSATIDDFTFNQLTRQSMLVWVVVVFVGDSDQVGDNGHSLCRTTRTKLPVN